MLQVARRTAERRFEWLARHAEMVHLNRLAEAALRGPFQLDELESFEANRYQEVLTMPDSGAFSPDYTGGPGASPRPGEVSGSTWPSPRFGSTPGGA